MCSGVRLGKLVWHSVVWRLRGWRRDYTHCTDPRQIRTWTPDYSKGWYWVAQARLLYVWWGSVNGSLQYCWHFIQERRRLGSSRLGWGAVFNKWLRHRSLSATSWHPCACHFTIHLLLHCCQFPYCKSGNCKHLVRFVWTSNLNNPHFSTPWSKRKHSISLTKVY